METVVGGNKTEVDEMGEDFMVDAALGWMMNTGESMCENDPEGFSLKFSDLFVPGAFYSQG